MGYEPKPASLGAVTWNRAATAVRRARSLPDATAGHDLPRYRLLRVDLGEGREAWTRRSAVLELSEVAATGPGPGQAYPG